MYINREETKFNFVHSTHELGNLRLHTESTFKVILTWFLEAFGSLGSSCLFQEQFLISCQFLLLPPRLPVFRSNNCSDEAPTQQRLTARQVPFSVRSLRIIWELLQISGLYLCTWCMENFKSPTLRMVFRNSFSKSFTKFLKVETSIANIRLFCWNTSGCGQL